jgi:hypothetical protein
MSYGQNGPLGLVPVNAMTGAAYNAQTTSAQIMPGYTRNIFRGDPVYIGTDGYLHNLGEIPAGVPGFNTSAIWGVFAGCSYTQPSATNPSDPASPGRPFWPAGTQTVNNSPVLAYYTLDSQTIYSIQSDAGGLLFTDVGSTFALSFTPTTAGATFPGGNLLTGNSSFVINTTTRTAPVIPTPDPIIQYPNLHVKVIGFDQTPGNPIPIPGGPPSPFVNALVVIQNHIMTVRN